MRSRPRARDDFLRRAVRRHVRRRARPANPRARTGGHHHRFRRRAPACRGRRSARRLQRPVGDGTAGSGARPAAHLRDVSPPRRGGAPRSPGRVRRGRLSRLQLPAGRSHPPPRRADRLLHQPTVVGVASGADEDDARARRPRARDFSFRGQIYQDAGVPVQWVGHPLLDVMPPPQPEDVLAAGLGLSAAAPIVALLPGSRRNEVGAILPDLAAAARRIRARLPEVQFAVARRRTSPTTCSRRSARLTARRRSFSMDTPTSCCRLPTSPSSHRGRSPCRPRCTNARWWWCTACRLSPTGSAARSSGSALLPWPTWSRGAAWSPTDPGRLHSGSVAAEALEILTNPARAAGMREDLRKVRLRLGTPGASDRAAQAVLEVARRGRATGLR